MKKIILFTIILISSFSNAQSDKEVYSKNTKFVYGAEGMEPKDFTVDIKGKNKEDLLSKAKEWLNEKYKNLETKNGKTDKTVGIDTIYEIEETNKDGGADEAGKGKNNIKLRFKGYTSNAICFGEKPDYGCEDVEYVIELRFKDGEYRFKPVKLTYKAASNKKKQKIELDKNKFYSSDGKIVNGYGKVPSQIETLFNGLNKSILNYLTNKKQEDEW
ncbi:hypothetical protein [Flavivirga jejuensis]|uniref:DUF4468 domain-containing protein n=1 Tax=Flavivirga jejuensis TaxID=870487 RepID=A0ABT8WIP9_9FLAO|nr:hypothetical protein [Flavivirga jejuensis]MDO5972993.1 hypothetical protein [Flavivirga jejuensis]